MIEKAMERTARIITGSNIRVEASEFQSSYNSSVGSIFIATKIRKRKYLPLLVRWGLLFHEVGHVIYPLPEIKSEGLKDGTLFRESLNIIGDIYNDSVFSEKSDVGPFLQYTALFYLQENYEKLYKLFLNGKISQKEVFLSIIKDGVVFHGRTGWKGFIDFFPEIKEIFEEKLFQIAEEARKARTEEKIIDLTNRLYEILLSFKSSDDEKAPGKPPESINNEGAASNSDEKETSDTDFSSSNDDSNNDEENDEESSDTGETSNSDEKETSDKLPDNFSKAIKKTLSTIKKEVSKKEKSSELKTAEETISRLSMQKKTDQEAIYDFQRYIHNNKEEHQELILLSHDLAEKTLRLIEDQISSKNINAKAGTFSSQEYVKKKNSLNWFYKQKHEKEFEKKEIALLVDISGSMCNVDKLSMCNSEEEDTTLKDRSWYAAIAARVFFEVMEKLKVKFSLVNFNHNAYSIADIDYIIPTSKGNTYPVRAVERLPDSTKAIIIITDGEIWNESCLFPPETEGKISPKLWGIGIRKENPYFIKRWVKVEKIEQLPKIVAQHLEKILLK